jgi:hypothetical protein
MPKGRSIRTSCTIETRKLDSGDVEVMLEKSTGDFNESTLHRELFILTDSPEVRTFLLHLKRIENAA